MKTSRIEQLLPFVYQAAVTNGSPLAAILDVMEALHGPAEAVLDQLDNFFDPYRAADAFVPYLASWVDLDCLLESPRSRMTASAPTLSTGIGHLRELTAAAVTLSQWRGTRKGLLLFLETATGLTGFTIDESAVGNEGEILPFHIRISAPAAILEHRPLIQRIIELEKPAYVTYDLIFALSGDAKTATT